MAGECKANSARTRREANLKNEAKSPDGLGGGQSVVSMMETQDSRKIRQTTDASMADQQQCENIEHGGQ